MNSNPEEVNLDRDSTLESLIEKARTGDRDALALFIRQPETKLLLNRASAWAGYKFKQDSTEIRDYLILMLIEKLPSIHNHRALDQWLNRAAKNYCLNEIRRSNRERAYINESEHAKHGSKKLRGHTILQSTSVPTPEQELADKERRLLFEEALRKASNKIPFVIADGWIEGKSPREIAQKTGIPLSTVYRLLKNFQKALVKEVFSVDTGRDVMPAPVKPHLGLKRIQSAVESVVKGK